MTVTELRPTGTRAGGPVATRFRLRRAGLVGLYEYEDETFEFERGRLLLRGPNGAGKSKALELLLPLLLDGELRAERLDPFGGRGRSMRWNLIGDEESRAPATGFSWLELHRVDEQGVERFVTLVLMARADKGEGGVKSWFAVLEAEHPHGGTLSGPRIGISASLTAGRTPLSKQAFAELAGGLIESASEYRARVNTVLFGVAHDRYEAVVRLLLSLRKPQLSQTLDPHELSDRLTEALPELDRDAVLRVSARLDQLDALREEAGTLREVSLAVARFALTYRDWARAALRERGGSLETKVREAELRRRALDGARAALVAAQERRAALALSHEELDEMLAAARAAERELRSGEAWRDAERLDELRRRAQHAERELATAENALGRADVDASESSRAAEQAAASLDRQRTVVEDRLEHVAQAAERAGIATHAAAVEALAAERRDVDAVGALLADLADTRRELLAEMDRLVRALQGAEEAHAAARTRFEEAEGRQRERQAERGRAEEQLTLVREQLLERLEAWLSGLERLVLDDAAAKELLTRASRAGDPEAPAVRELVSGRATAAERELHAEMARIEATRAGLAAEREPLSLEQARLRDREEPVPDPLPFRTADRAARLGAPLWGLVDFAEGLEGGERAGLEAALEGAGLLDAWVMPDGLVLDADDALLVIGEAPTQSGATLARALVPVPDAPVPAEVIAGVLARVALHDTLPAPASLGSQAAAVAHDGGFALGPLHGRHRADAARFIGAAARAANRERRLAELAALLAELDGRDRGLAGEAAATQAALDVLADELRRRPDDIDAVRAHEQLQRARDEERRAAELTASEQTAMTARAQEREAARTAALAHSREHALPAPEDALGLQAVREALADYRGSCREALDAERVRRDFDAHAAAAALHAERFGEVLAAAAQRRRDAAQEQSARAAAHREAVDAVGASVEALRARLAELEGDAEQAERGLREVQAEKEEAAGEQARAQSEADHAADEVSLAESEVARAHAALTRLGGLGAWGLALGNAAPEDHERSAQWPLDRALTALGSVAREAVATRRGWQTLMGDVETEADELRHRLSGRADFVVIRQRVPEDPELTRVEVRHSGQARPIAELERWLEEELDARERAMADEDRRLFESFLVGGLADALRERIGGARELVVSMNDALEGCTTSSGMGIELDWRAREHDDPALREAVALLARDVALLGDEARARLVEFLRRRIEDARHSLEQGSSTEHVMAALDYRNWHEFRVIQVREGRREALTRRRHQQGSGGEKAVALHLPLFAAAAAQFAAARPEAPRMILLDEAFAGIDERMRAQLLSLLERFDLDFVLTSHELWGCYPECSALGIYHLHREPGIPGVATAHFRWDGERRIEVVDAA
ncbi:MAG: TIGR02680 family protein [Solirubrobacteraceae bacterium]